MNDPKIIIKLPRLTKRELRLVEQINELRAELETWRNGADNMARECERLKAVLEASNLAVVMMGESLAESRKLVAELEAARKVADAADKWQSAADQYTARHALFALRAAVREYRANAEPPRCKFKFNEPEPPPHSDTPCDLGHDNPNLRQKDATPLSPGKREVIAAAIEKLEDEDVLERREA